MELFGVEDDKESRIQALKMFENYFSHIDVSVNGIDGLNKYENYFYDTNSYYDLVITDIQMPQMNGIDMSKAIYKLNIHQKIIVVSAYNDKKYFIDLINLGVEGFIQKPLSFKQVSDALSQLSLSIKDNSTVSLSQNCTYNKLSRELLHNHKKIETTNNEYKFIEFLIQNQNLTFTIEDIFNYIHYDVPDKEFTENAIKGLVKRLRKKLPDDLIIHSRTTGYSINMD
ncbi:MAG: response regulator [Helicobacteraceae bacterium]|nr:response regulator [Helicobacteraceae bacterium]